MRRLLLLLLAGCAAAPPSPAVTASPRVGPSQHHGLVLQGGHRGAFIHLAMSPDGQLLARMNVDIPGWGEGDEVPPIPFATVSLLDSRGRHHASWRIPAPSPEGISQLTFSPDGSQLQVNGRRARRWNLQDGTSEEFVHRSWMSWVDGELQVGEDPYPHVPTPPPRPPLPEYPAPFFEPGLAAGPNPHQWRCELFSTPVAEAPPSVASTYTGAPCPGNPACDACHDCPDYGCAACHECDRCDDHPYIDYVGCFDASGDAVFSALSEFDDDSWVHPGAGAVFADGTLAFAHDHHTLLRRGGPFQTLARRAIALFLTGASFDKGMLVLRTEGPCFALRGAAVERHPCPAQPNDGPIESQHLVTELTAPDERTLARIIPSDEIRERRYGPLESGTIAILALPKHRTLWTRDIEAHLRSVWLSESHVTVLDAPTREHLHGHLHFFERQSGRYLQGHRSPTALAASADRSSFATCTHGRLHRFRSDGEHRIGPPCLGDVLYEGGNFTVIGDGATADILRRSDGSRLRIRLVGRLERDAFVHHGTPLVVAEAESSWFAPRQAWPLFRQRRSPSIGSELHSLSATSPGYSATLVQDFFAAEQGSSE